MSHCWPHWDLLKGENHKQEITHCREDTGHHPRKATYTQDHGTRNLREKSVQQRAVRAWHGFPAQAPGFWPSYCFSRDSSWPPLGGLRSRGITQAPDIHTLDASTSLCLQQPQLSNWGNPVTSPTLCEPMKSPHDIPEPCNSDLSESELEPDCCGSSTLLTEVNSCINIFS